MSEATAVVLVARCQLIALKILLVLMLSAIAVEIGASDPNVGHSALADALAAKVVDVPGPSALADALAAKAVDVPGPSALADALAAKVADVLAA